MLCKTITWTANNQDNANYISKIKSGNNTFRITGHQVFDSDPNAITSSIQLNLDGGVGPYFISINLVDGEEILEFYLGTSSH